MREKNSKMDIRQEIAINDIGSAVNLCIATIVVGVYAFDKEDEDSLQLAQVVASTEQVVSFFDEASFKRRFHLISDIDFNCHLKMYILSKLWERYDKSGLKEVAVRSMVVVERKAKVLMSSIIERTNTNAHNQHTDEKTKAIIRVKVDEYLFGGHPLLSSVPEESVLWGNGVHALAAAVSSILCMLFELAHESKPSMVFIVGIDPLAGSRNEGESEGSRRSKMELLVQMNGVRQDHTGQRRTKAQPQRRPRPAPQACIDFSAYKMEDGSKGLDNDEKSAKKDPQDVSKCLLNIASGFRVAALSVLKQTALVDTPDTYWPAIG
ncbi:hypothetical protein IW261DRAFT_1426331 [Armillaria novae-zelandiae]|uniref:Uncharacterized protein n=1 Tax=Armillaria novae-zelandiae TaxID=153914 RepID=A0AA39NMQ4_9AGAR|nr:hypothetical protein IW261DRAFT_1426331 [Armillaria novae-zelandiae]